MSSIDVRIGTTKVKTGCMTCRSRHIKCDENWTRGCCQKCLKSRRNCAGPPTAHPVRFVNYSTSGTARRYGSQRLHSPAVENQFCSSPSGNCIDPFNILPRENHPALDNCKSFTASLCVLHSNKVNSIWASLLENGSKNEGFIRALRFQQYDAI